LGRGEVEDARLDAHSARQEVVTIRQGLPGPGRQVVAGDLGHGEAHRGVGVDLQQGAARGWGEVVGVGGAEDGGRVGGAEGAQADPVAQVAVQAVEAGFVQPLRGEQQVHAEAAADPADGGEAVEELGAGGQQLAELVDDDQQIRQGLDARIERTSGRVAAQVWLVAGLAEQPLASGLLALEGGHGPVDHGQVDVGQPSDCTT
jgi:hypothetical protein